MNEEAKRVIDAMKQAFDIFDKMELPIEERKCTLEYDSVIAIIKALEQVTKERDAVEVVRCMDCVEYIPYGDYGDRICGRIGSYFGNTKPSDFCSRGIRKMDSEVE